LAGGPPPSAAAAGGALAAKAGGAIHGFLALIERLAGESRGLALHEQVDQVLKASGLIEHYRREKAERGEARVENLDELVSGRARLHARGGGAAAARGVPGARRPRIRRRPGDEWEDCVQMMTLHSAKGLEFPVVFLCGMEEGLFPASTLAHRPRRPGGRAPAVVMSA